MAQEQYKCEVCGATSESRSKLEEHRRKMHPKYGCEICGETFSSEHSLEIHTQIAHPEEIPTRQY